jgi:signal transduction histidine kinase
MPHEEMRTTAPSTSTIAPIIALRWGPVIAGALSAAALAFVLHSFAAAIGFAASSTAPTWRDASFALWFASGLYLVLAALASYGLGGYVAGRLRPSLAAAADDGETEMRDGVHGLLVWALATLLTAVVAFAAAQSLTRLAAPSAGSSGPAVSVGGENIIAYDLDRLFRAERRPNGDDLTYARSEAARILLTAAGHSGVSTEDRGYLARLVAARTGVAGPEAERRVDAIIGTARENINRARRASIVLAFMAGAAALLGAAAAWFAAAAGGRHRDGEKAPSLASWSWRGPRLTHAP